MSELALLGGKPVREKPYPSWPRFGEEEKNFFWKFLNQGSGGGAENWKIPTLR